LARIVVADDCWLTRKLLLTTCLEDKAANLVAGGGADAAISILPARTRFSLETHLSEWELILIFQVGALGAVLQLIGVPQGGI